MGYAIAQPARNPEPDVVLVSVQRSLNPEHDPRTNHRGDARAVIEKAPMRKSVIRLRPLISVRNPVATQKIKKNRGPCARPRADHGHSPGVGNHKQRQVLVGLPPNRSSYQERLEK